MARMGSGSLARSTSSRMGLSPVQFSMQTTTAPAPSINSSTRSAPCTRGTPVSRIRTGARGRVERGAWSVKRDFGAGVGPLVTLEGALILLQVGLDSGDDALEVQQLPTGEGRRVCHHEVGQLAAQAALAVHQLDGLNERGVRDIYHKPSRQMLPELTHLKDPMLERVGVLGLLRQFDHIHRLGSAHQLEHLLLAVAGGFGHDQVRPVEEGVLAGDVVAERGLDERAEVCRQVLFRRRDGGGRTAAQAHRHPARRQDDLARGELAHDPDDRPAVALGGFGVVVAVVDHAAEPAQRVWRLIARHWSSLESVVSHGFRFLEDAWPSGQTQVPRDPEAERTLPVRPKATGPECARPRAQPPPTCSERCKLPRPYCLRTSLRPRTGALRCYGSETRRLAYDSEALPAPVIAVHANQGTSFAGIAKSIAAFDRDCVNAALSMRRGLSAQEQRQVPGDNPVRLGGIRRLVAADRSDPVGYRPALVQI